MEERKSMSGEEERRRKGEEERRRRGGRVGHTFSWLATLASAQT
jgi:hypothetical protein